MKKSIFISLIILASVASVFAQQEKAATFLILSFTKAELLAFKDIKEFLALANKNQDYSKYLIRNFNLVTTVKNADGTTTKLSEMGPGGVWSVKQKEMIEKFAKKGIIFSLEDIVMIEQGKKGVINQSNVSFSIKE